MALCVLMMFDINFQASFKPLGITIAVAKDRAIESLMQVGDTFVLNCLEEGKYAPLMKHFLKRFPAGGNHVLSQSALKHSLSCICSTNQIIKFSKVDEVSNSDE